MKYSISIFCLVFVLGFELSGQPNTEVYLFDMKVENSSIEISNPMNISENPGYDNQPSFLLDGSAVLFSSSRNQQTDIVKYDLETGKKTWLTNTEGSEYSPTHMPDQQGISAILLERDGRQLLWEYEMDGAESQVLVPYLKIGYHTWLDDNTLFAFVLGPHSTLQMINLKNQRTEIILEDIGRSLHKIPGENKISFVDKSTETWVIKSYNPSKSQTEDFIATPEGAEDMVWLEDGSILIGEGNKILKWNVDSDTTWVEVVNLEKYNLSNITRMAVHPRQTKLAVVVAE